MFKFSENKKILILYSSIIFSFTAYFIYLNFLNESGYWYDEWCTLLSSDPNVDLEKIFERHRGNSEKPYENVPIIYYLVLRFFFEVFGFTSQNGRIFSLIFYLLSSTLLYFLARKKLDEYQSFFVTTIFLSTPFIVWMSNETSVDMFLIFFSLMNLLLFFNSLEKRNFISFLFLISSNVLTLSIYPLTISLVFTQALFAILRKNLNLFFIIIFSIIIYFFLNYEYFLERSLNRGHHFATLNFNFFIGYYFNIFFGSIFFGALYIFIFTFLLIKNFKKIYESDFLLLIILSILITYIMVIVSSLFVTPIAAPRYIIFIIPLILIFIFVNIFVFEKKRFFFLICFVLSITNVSLNYDERFIKKPKIDEALLIVKNLNENKIFIEPQSKLFTTYITTVKNIDDFKIINKSDVKTLRYNTFVVFCLINPTWDLNVKTKEDDEQCIKNSHGGYKKTNKINFNDFLIIKFEKDV